MAGADSSDSLASFSSDENDILLDAEGECSVTLFVDVQRSHSRSGRRKRESSWQKILVSAVVLKLRPRHFIHINPRGASNLPWFDVVSYGTSLGGNPLHPDGAWPIEWNDAEAVCISHISGYQLTWRVQLSRARLLSPVDGTDRMARERWNVMVTHKPDVQAL
jgi:hypothetical protein